MSFFKEEKRTQYSPLMTREEQVRDDDAKDAGRHRTRQSVQSNPIQSKSRQRDDSREQNARARRDDGDTDYD